MKFLFIIALMGLFSIGAAQQTERRMIEAFEELSILGNVEVVLQKGDEPGLEILADEVEFDKIITKMEGRTLKISLKPGFYRDALVKINLNYETLKVIRLQAGAKVYAEETIEEDRLEIKAGSGSELDATVRVNSIYIKVGEGSVVLLTGEAEYEEVQVATGGQLLGDDLKAKEVNVKINTGGEAEVYAIESVEGKVNTGGNLLLMGNPRADYIKTSLGGNVRKIAH